MREDKGAPNYRLQVEFDFNSRLPRKVIENMMYDYFFEQLKTWNTYSNLMTDMDNLRVEVINNG